MKKNNQASILFVLLILASLFSLSLAGDKRSRDDAESSSARENKFGRFQIDSSQQTSLLNLLKGIVKSEFQCTPEALASFDGQTYQAKINKFLESCDAKFDTWLNDKILRLGGIGEMIKRWSKSIKHSVEGKSRNFRFFLEQDIRPLYTFSRKFKNTWGSRDMAANGIESAESSRRAFHYGDGICVHILSSPFDRVEQFMGFVLENFTHLQYVKNLKKTTSPGITIYIFQKLCRKFSIPKPERNRPLDIIAPEGFFPNFESILKGIDWQKQTDGYSDWSILYHYKLLYIYLNNLGGQEEFKYLQKAANDSLDAFVHWHCLSTMKSKDETLMTSDKVKGLQEEKLFTELMDLLTRTINSYPLQPDQSINDALDIRSPNNKFREYFFTQVATLIIDYNFELAKFIIDLVLGHIDDFQKSLFMQPSYKRKISELELPEFLFNVFSIKGYKPRISSPLLDLYYLHKLSETCAMIPVDISKIISMMVVDKRSELSLLRRDNFEQTELAPIVRNQNNSSAKIESDEIEHISRYESICTPEALMQLQNFNHEASTNFLIECDSQVKEWWEKKTERIDSLATVIHRWMITIANSLYAMQDKDFVSMFENDLKDVEKLVTGQTYWNHCRPQMGIILDEETIQNSRRAYIYGDGVCIHLLSAPFDRVEHFMKTVLSDLHYLEYVKNFKRLPPTISLKIYVIQKLCRKFNEKTRKMQGNDGIISTLFTIEDPVYALSNLNYMFGEIEEKLGNGLNCDWSSVFNRKRLYRILRLIQDDRHTSELKSKADHSLDALVANCLSSFSEKGAGRIYARLSDTPLAALLPALSMTLSKTLKSYQLPSDQSINNALDIRSSNNEFKELLMTNIKDYILQSSDEKVAKLFVDFLQGHRVDAIFEEKIYKDKGLVEYKFMEFLFHVFDIKGYKPSADISSSLLDFYYLYKIGEICDMIPIGVK